MLHVILDRYSPHGDFVIYYRRLVSIGNSGHKSSTCCEKLGSIDGLTHGVGVPSPLRPPDQLFYVKIPLFSKVRDQAFVDFLRIKFSN